MAGFKFTLNVLPTKRENKKELIKSIKTNPKGRVANFRKLMNSFRNKTF